MSDQKDRQITIHTSATNEKPELMGLECRNCGGVLELIDRTHAVCPYCGQKYLIDEAKGTVINIQVDYSGDTEMRRAVGSARNALLIFLAVAAVLVVIILGFNIAAKKSVFSTSDKDIPVDAHGELLVIFFQDIFEKEYKNITKEELESIRYIKCSYEREGSETYNVISYSFTDYKDCESEEEFQDTIKKWTYRMHRVSWPSDYTMLTGLTRIDTTESVWMSLNSFPKDNQITCVDTKDSLSTVSAVLDPAQIQVLHMGIMARDLEQIGQYQNLVELEVDTNLPDKEVDVSFLSQCPRLERLKLRCGESYTGLEGLGKLSGLKSLYIDHVELGDCRFLEQLTGLEELSVYTGKEPDLTVLEGLTSLTKAEFLDTEYIPCEEIAKLGDLEELVIAIEDPDALKQIAAIESLKVLKLHMAIDEYQVPTDVSCLAALTNLERFYLDNFWDSDLTGLEPVLNLPGLAAFRYGKRRSTKTDILLDPGLLSDNPIMEEIAFLNCFPKDAGTGKALDFGFLSHYPNVKRLYLDGCELREISFVSNLENLRICSLQDNEIRDLSPLSSCRKLELISVDKEAAAGTRFSGDVEVNTESYVTIYD